ncbi:4-hydroxyphenylpyruvate dioxygenase-like protein isoform X2 [Maylandia zebra]|uniref:4-hydroxyphenylpyruvate dioxygenase-like protein isoform X2 n=1 Tax=Maylandia zebra TaxID=106582 RepID=UPI00403C7C4E
MNQGFRFLWTRPFQNVTENMAVFLSRLHHVSLHVSNAEKIANDLVSKFKFDLFAARLTDKSKQFAFRKGAAVFVVNERPSKSSVGLNEGILGLADRYSIDPQRADLEKYKQGFDVIEKDWSLGEEDMSCPVTHFDHITYACPRKTTHQVMGWYEKVFGFQRFFIDSNEDVDEGFVINQEGIGLRLTAMEYWKCSKAGIALPFAGKKEPDCKFVIAESLPEQGRNQVDTFLEQHRAPGIQHIGLYTKNIVSTAHTMAEAGVQFSSPPPAYYTQLGKQQEIEEAGHSPQMLAQHGILLDTDLHQDPLSQRASSESKRHLLQVFTKPIFAENTFFLELIERRGATGFGEGNIKALWQSVQAYMENERVDRQEPQGSSKTAQTALS